MNRSVIPESFKQDEKLFLNRFMDDVLGVIDLTDIINSPPTTVGSELKEGELGFYSSALYITLRGVTYSILLTPV